MKLSTPLLAVAAWAALAALLLGAPAAFAQSRNWVERPPDESEDELTDLEKLDQEIGDLGAELLIDFFVKELGPAVYNQAISDAQAFFQDKLVDLEVQLYEEEPRS